jgi:hypothetical protein
VQKSWINQVGQEPTRDFTKGPFGYSTYSDRIGARGRGMSFMISPKVGKLAIARGQTHNDYAFEVLHLGKAQHEEIVGFYKGLENLYYGNYKLYLEELKKIISKINKPNE